MGIYSGYIRKGGRISVGLGAGKDSRIHLDKAREKGVPLKAAVVIGPMPNLIYAAASTFPYGVDEFAVAGAIAGKPLELVRCRTAEIYVPAQAEMILEGEISPDEMDHNWPFGESFRLHGRPRQVSAFYRQKYYAPQKHHSNSIS